MRKLYTSAIRTKCAHSGTPYNAGRAVYQALHVRSFAGTPSCRSEDSKQPAVRWYEQTRRDKSSIRPYEGANVADRPENSLLNERELDALERQLRSLQDSGTIDLKEEDLDDLKEEDLENLLKNAGEDGSPSTALNERDLEEFMKDEDDDNPEAEKDTRDEKQLELDGLEGQFERELEELGVQLEALDTDGAGRQDDPSSLSGDPTDVASYNESEALRYQRVLRAREKQIQKELEGLRTTLKKLDGLDEDALRKKSNKTIRSNSSTALALQDEDENSDLTNLEMEFQMPRVIRNQIKAFNTALKKVAENPAHIYHRRNLWITYARCQRTVPGFLEQISEPAWKVLWDSQSSEPFYDEQAEHLLILARNMRQVRKHLSGTQKILCIKAYESDGRLEEAIDLWNQERKTLQKDKHLRFEFNALGVTLECLLKRPDRAEAIALEAIARDGSSSGAARLTFPVIGAWARQGSESSLKRAWGLYIFARQSLSRQPDQEHRMTAEDHDDIFLAFFDAGRRDIALMVFKDLILLGQNSIYDSVSLFKSMGLGLEKIHSNLTSTEELNKISLDALAVLPKTFENKYFYSSWMKRLIGMGRIDAAVSVVELMYERGVSPDPKHLNGIIGYWLRQGSQQEQEQALDLAWSMVDERAKLVERRYHRRGEDLTAEKSDQLRRHLPKHVDRRVPSASTETFCLLLLYYTNKNLPSQVERVRELLSQVELAPNSYFMNHLMLSYSNQKKTSQVWSLFTTMSTKTKPDMASWEILWDIAVNMTSKYEQMDKFPGPRRLISAMMDWFSQLPPVGKERAIEGVDARLYNRVLRTFCNWKDLNGTLAAMYILRDTFGLLPDELSIRLVSTQVAQSGESRKAPHPLGRPRTRRRRAPGADTAKNIESAGRALEMLSENRQADLADQGIAFEELSEKQLGEERLFVLGEFLRAAQRQQVSVTEATEIQELSEEFDRVAWEMGGGPFRMGPPVYDSSKALEALEAKTLDVS